MLTTELEKIVHPFILDAGTQWSNDLNYLNKKKKNDYVKLCQKTNGRTILAGKIEKGIPSGKWKYFHGNGQVQYFTIHTERVGSVCVNGERTKSIGCGACSGKGGVDYWEHKVVFIPFEDNNPEIKRQEKFPQQHQIIPKKTNYQDFQFHALNEKIANLEYQLKIKNQQLQNKEKSCISLLKRLQNKEKENEELNEKIIELQKRLSKKTKKNESVLEFNNSFSSNHSGTNSISSLKKCDESAIENEKDRLSESSFPDIFGADTELLDKVESEKNQKICE